VAIRVEVSIIHAEADSLSNRKESQGVIQVADSLTMAENKQFFTWTAERYPW